MNFMKDFAPIFIQFVLIPLLTALLTALTGIIVKWINSKAAELKAKTDNIYLKSAIEMLDNAISSAVVAVNQTYVDELKKENAFTPEAQREAFQRVYKVALNSLTEETTNYLATHIGDIQGYIENKIEQKVVETKKEG